MPDHATSTTEARRAWEKLPRGPVPVGVYEAIGQMKRCLWCNTTTRPVRYSANHEAVLCRKCFLSDAP